VITPSYNCGRFLDEAIRSALAQSYRDFEIIVVDDGSTDMTQDVLARYDGSIAVIRQNNRGVSAARNRAIAVATGEFLAYLDADDVWLPAHLQRGVEFLDDHADCGLVHSDFHFIDEAGTQIITNFNRQPGLRIMHGRCLHDLLQFSTIAVPTVIERRSCVEDTGGFNESLSYAEDYQHWIRVALAGHAFGYLDEALALKRRRDESLSRSRDPATLARWDEFLLLIFRPLLENATLRRHLDPTAEKIVRSRIDACYGNLAYNHRMLGDLRLARAHALAWRRFSPKSAGPYLELAKSLVPEFLARRVREARG